MNRRRRTVADELNVRGTYILDTFNDYLEDVYWVNRRYQRKLVWTLEEKQKFIDTILHNYPVPIFLLAKYKLDGEDSYRKEIIDGLQRLNAIFSFIKNEFSVKWQDGNFYYFNVSALAGAEQMLADGILTQEENKLELGVCRKFLNYQLPITTTEVSDTEIEDIFIRINSTGRKLSAQDLRQAGAVGLFSDLVRKTACYIRGDITEKDVVSLSKMPSLSLSHRKLNYAINLYDTFWMKNRILTEKNLRLSRDEEIIARLYSYMILGNKVSPSSNSLNKMYDSDSRQNTELNTYIENYGLLEMMDNFSKVYSDFNKIFRSVDSNFSAWLFRGEDAKGRAKVFQALFLALYNLRKSQFDISDFRKIANAIKYIGDKEFKEITNDEEWNIEVRNTAIRRITSIIQPLMTKNIKLAENNEWRLKLETLLSAASGIESQMFDFKLGLTTLQTGQRNRECVSKIVKTLTAMANTKPNEEATVLIGIANDLEHARQFRNYYGANWVQVAECYVTGIDEEIRTYWKSKEEYCNFIKRAIENEPVLSEVSSQILRNFQVITYEDKTLIILTLKSTGKPLAYAEEFYERHGSHNSKVGIGTPEFYGLFQRCSTVNLGSCNLF